MLRPHKGNSGVSFNARSMKYKGDGSDPARPTIIIDYTCFADGVLHLKKSFFTCTWNL